jgi:hypothetical protein
MPLPPLAPSATERYWIDYTSMEIQHSVMFRTNQVLDAPAAFFSDVILRMTQNMRSSDTILIIRHAAQGSDVTFPVATVGESGTLSDASSIADDPESVFVSVTYRGNPSGRKGRYDFFFSSNVVPLDANNRFPSDAVTSLLSLYNEIGFLAAGASPSGRLVSIGEDNIFLNPYFNRAKSGYWQRKQRLG